MSATASLLLLGLDRAGVGLAARAQVVVSAIDFDDALLHGMLGLLLFAGALHVDLGEVARQKWTILILATAGTLASTAVVGVLAWRAALLLGLDLPLDHALLFGALISPTDPIAVLGIIKKAGAPRSLEIKIAGESLFNDGVGVVLFIVLAGVVSGGEATAGQTAVLLLRETFGGALFGLAIGYAAFRALRSVDNYVVEILITLALTTGGYALAEALHVSAPIAAVVSGLLIGNQGRALAMSDTTREHLDLFWELIDEILNALLFVLMGLEILVLAGRWDAYALALAAIPIALVARWLSVGVPVTLMKRFRRFSPYVVTLLTWGGLRGGISVALALSLPARVDRDLILTMTYGVVMFSILVQGLSMGRLLRWTTRRQGR